MLKTLTSLALACAAIASHAAEPWQYLATVEGSRTYFMPSSVDAPTSDTRRVILKINTTVALFEYKCSARTAAMLMVMRPGGDPYLPSEAARAARGYGVTSVHAVMSDALCGGWL